jgi:hypothetical protein
MKNNASVNTKIRSGGGTFENNDCKYENNKWRFAAPQGENEKKLETSAL